MKFILGMVLVLGSSMAIANDVKDFNKILIEDVQNDIETDNDQNLKVNNGPMRGPASVENEDSEPVIKEDLKINTKDKQIGNPKW